MNQTTTGNGDDDDAHRRQQTQLSCAMKVTEIANVKQSKDKERRRRRRPRWQETTVAFTQGRRGNKLSARKARMRHMTKTKTVRRIAADDDEDVDEN